LRGNGKEYKQKRNQKAAAATATIPNTTEHDPTPNRNPKAYSKFS